MGALDRRIRGAFWLNFLKMSPCQKGHGNWDDEVNRINAHKYLPVSFSADANATAMCMPYAK